MRGEWPQSLRLEPCCDPHSRSSDRLRVEKWLECMQASCPLSICILNVKEVYVIFPLMPASTDILPIWTGPNCGFNGG